MAVKMERINTRELVVGMYVAQLDRPWIETPFPLQGFHIRSEDDITKLRAWCKEVYIDLELGKTKVDPVKHARSNKSKAPNHKVIGNIGKFKPVRYEVKESLKKEVVTASVYHREVTKAVIHMLKDLRAGKALNARVARKAAVVMVHSVVRNPDAMVWLARVKEADGYTYAHSIRASILATVFGRHIGLPKEVLENLAAGVLMMDIGKSRMPRSMLMGSQPLTADEDAEMRRHVEYGVQMLRGSEDVDDQIIGIVQYHHERYDGSGYPFGLAGGQIPLLARIAGIVDTYDAITSPRPWAQARTSTEAVSILYEQRDKAFHAELVEQFIQAIGVYPTGTPVQLSNKDIGVVIAQNSDRRLRPKVMIVMKGDKTPLPRPYVIDLLKSPQDGSGKSLSIAGCLKQGAGGLDLASLQINAA